MPDKSRYRTSGFSAQEHLSGKRVNQACTLPLVILCVPEVIMTVATKPKAVSLIRKTGSAFLVLAGGAFWFGGGLIHAIANTERLLAEVEGIALAALFLGPGVIAKLSADGVEEGDGSISLTESLRK